MKRLLLASTVFLSATSLAHAETINILMESVPDTRFVQDVLPEFTEATGIEVELEVVNYAEMHTKLVPQLVSPTGSYDAIVVDFYWVGEFTKAGWLEPLDEHIAADGFDTSIYFPALMNLVGQVDGVTYMLPFYNYAMGPDLPEGHDRRSGRAGGVQGKNTASISRCRKPGTNMQSRLSSSRAILTMTARPTSTAWSTRVYVPIPSPWSGPTTSTLRAVSITKKAHGSRCSTRRKPSLRSKRIRAI